MLKELNIWSEETFGSWIWIIDPSSNKLDAICIAGDSLVSLVFALIAKPKIANFLPEIVPNNFSTIIFEIRLSCHVFISITFCQYSATSFNP